MTDLPMVFDYSYSPLEALHWLYLGQFLSLKAYRVELLERKANPPTDEEVLQSVAEDMLDVEEEFAGRPFSATERLKLLAELTSSERPAAEDALEQDLEEVERYLKGLKALFVAIQKRDIPMVVSILLVQIQDLETDLSSTKEIPEQMRALGSMGDHIKTTICRRESEIELLKAFVKVLTDGIKKKK